MGGDLRNLGFALNHSFAMRRNTLPMHIWTKSSSFASLQPQWLFRIIVTGSCTAAGRGKILVEKRCNHQTLAQRRKRVRTYAGSPSLHSTQHLLGHGGSSVCSAPRGCESAIPEDGARNVWDTGYYSWPRGASLISKIILLASFELRQ